MPAARRRRSANPPTGEWPRTGQRTRYSARATRKTPTETRAARPNPASVSARRASGAGACRLRTPASAAPREPAIASTVIAGQAAPEVKPAVRENTRNAATSRMAAAAACVRYRAKSTVGTTKAPRAACGRPGAGAASAFPIAIIGWRIVSSQAPALPPEDPRLGEPQPAQAVQRRRAQAPQTVAHAGSETDRRGLREVLAGA